MSDLEVLQFFAGIVAMAKEEGVEPDGAVLRVGRSRLTLQMLERFVRDGLTRLAPTEKQPFLGVLPYVATSKTPADPAVWVPSVNPA